MTTSLKTKGLPNLRRVRQAQHLSIGQLVDMTDGRLTKEKIIHLESGRLEPEPWHIRLLAQLLEIPLVDLVS